MYSVLKMSGNVTISWYYYSKMRFPSLNDTDILNHTISHCLGGEPCPALGDVHKHFWPPPTTFDPVVITPNVSSHYRAH